MLYIICFKALRDNWFLLNFIFQDHGSHFLTWTCPEMTNVYKLHKLLVLLDIPKGKIRSGTIGKKKKKTFLPRNNSLSPVLAKQSCRPLVPYGWRDSLRFGAKESCFVHHNRQYDSFKAIILHFCEVPFLQWSDQKNKENSAWESWRWTCGQWWTVWGDVMCKKGKLGQFSPEGWTRITSGNYEETDFGSA